MERKWAHAKMVSIKVAFSQRMYCGNPARAGQQKARTTRFGVGGLEAKSVFAAQI